MIGLLMSLNAVGVFGFLIKAHLDHMVTVDMALADKVAGTEARLAIQAQTVADLDRRIAQIDSAIEESTRLGRPVGAMTIADQKRRNRADIVAARQREAQALASLQIDKVRIDAERRRAEADVGPVRYLAELIGMPTTDLERPVRMLTLALVAVLDPMAVGTAARRRLAHDERTLGLTMEPSLAEGREMIGCAPAFGLSGESTWRTDRKLSIKHAANVVPTALYCSPDVGFLPDHLQRRCIKTRK
jgi:hypothetical protein